MSQKDRVGRKLVRLSVVVVLSVCVLLQRQAAGATLELQLSGADEPLAPAFPVRTGVPIEPGQLTDAGHVRLLVNGVETDLQTEVLARYSDRSVKWLLLDFVAAPGAKLTLEFGEGVTRKPVARPISVSADEKGATVNTGILRAAIRRDGGGFPDELYLDLNGDGKYSPDERLATKGDVRANWMDLIRTPALGSHEVMSAVVTEGTLDPSRVEITGLDIEVPGPLHAVVKVTANYRYKDAARVEYPYANPQYCELLPKDMGRIPFVMRLHFYRGSGAMEVQHTFIWEGDPDLDFVRDLALASPMPTSGDAVVTLGTDEGHLTVERRGSDRIGLLQTSADTYRVWRSRGSQGTGVVAEGRRAPGWMDVSNGRWGVTACVWRSWQLYPKGLRADVGAGQLRVSLWPAEAGPLTFRRYTRDWGVSETGARGGVNPFAVSRHASRGVAKTHRVLFDFHVGRVAADELGLRTAWFRQKVRAWPSLEVMCSTRARLGAAISPVQKDVYNDLEDIITACLDWMLFNQEHFRWYGMLDYGDLQQCFQNVHHHGRWESDYGRWGWFNGDASGHKPYAALLMHFLRTGRRDIFDLYEAEILHIIDVDMVNSEEYPWNDEGWLDMRGCGHRHNGQHWACFYVGSRAMRIGYFSQLYYLTGDERLRDAMDVAAAAAWKELGEARASRGGHSGTQDMTSRLFYTVERTGDRKVRDLIAGNERWAWMLNSNRGAAELKAAEEEEDDLEWARRPAEGALTAKKDWRYPGTVVSGLAGGVRYITDTEDRERYREALEQAVEHMRTRFAAGPQGLPRDRWPGPRGGPIQGNWNPIPNLMPIAIHAMTIHDAARKGGER